MTSREAALSVVDTLRKAGFEAWFAGGCVRDRLLGRQPGDHDVATNAIPDEVQRLFRRTIAVGKQFGVILVLVRDREIEVATFRADSAYTDGRHPDAVTFSDMESDVRRRDFTINGMMEDPVDGRVIDLVGGQEDLRGRLIRAIGDPERRFEEDRLRMLRAARFAAQLEFAVEPATLRAIARHAAALSSVSRERIKEELDKLLGAPGAPEGLRLLRETGLLRAIVPALADLPEADWRRTVGALSRMPRRPGPAALAALLHRLDPDPARNAALAEAILRDLRASNGERERVVWILARLDAAARAAAMKPSEWKPLLAHPGAAELLQVTRAVLEEDGGGSDGWALLEERSRRDDLDPPRLIGGEDIMAMGVPKGPRIGELLAAVREAQLNGEIGNPGEARERVSRWIAGGI
ncbi:MAG: CCA tRNA nucleotidyltransferase [Candidatus Brocadiae bacterium]|nr:CCA tRNA nucleotidyltransferase [Candidatus Brocadiia bacterium]